MTKEERMTREEAIENLRRLQNLLFNDPYIDTSTIIATCNIAIEALEQQPCIQEKQANADKIDAVYIDGFKAGYSQARFDLEQEPCDEEYIKIPKKALKYRTAGMVAYNTEWLKNHFDIERAVICGEQEPCEDAISRQEAIRIASGYCHWANIPKELAKLPSVNPIQCEDAISRQAVLDMIDNAQIITDGEFRGYCTEDIDISILPSVSTEKTGRWIYVQYDSNPNIGNWHCSECRNIVFQCVEKKGIHNEVIYKFCPWCGAKMEVEE